MNRIFSVLIRFQENLGILWRAFLHPKTPFYLKAIMVAVVIYLISPIDILPDFIAVLGWVDDVLLVTFAVNWIAARLPEEIFDSPHPTRRAPRYDPNEDSGPIINGRARRD